MILNEAKNIALDVWNKLKPQCTIIKIAGSIRREKPEIGDVEIVALPKTETGTDLFGGPTEKVRIPSWKEKVFELGIVEKGNHFGKYMQIHLAQHDIDLDLFMPDVFDYWRQTCIRTGSAEWVQKFVAGGWRNLGWVGSDAGLRLQSECVSKTSETDGKKHWKCIVAKSEQTLPPHWKSEQEFFAWLGLKWIEPKYRTI